MENAYEIQPKLKQMGTKDGPVTWARAACMIGPPTIISNDKMPFGFCHCAAKTNAVELSAME